MFSTRIKILVGYALLAVVLVSATWMVYDNTRSLSAVNEASERLMARRDIVDSLVFTMLETANAERSVLLGDAGKWQRFDEALGSSAAYAMRLRPLLADTLKQQRLDSLITLLKAKRENTLLVMKELNNDCRDIYYNNKLEALHSGRDSIVISPQTKERHEQHETVYEVVKTKRGFFRRLGDAFRKQHTDTVSTTRLTHQPSTATINHRLNIADSVANVLAEIHSEQQRASDRQQDAISSRNRQLQRVSIQLTKRTWLLIEDIQSDEHNALQRVVGKAMSSRRAMIVRIAVLGLLAILSAAILVVYILRDIKRERRDRQRIIEAKAETERIMQQRERLLLTITHDIKAPAASIAGFIDLLSEYVDQPKAVGYLQNISGSAKHLLQLVSALLDYHKLESGKAERHEVSFAPAVLISECVAQMQPLAMEKKLKLATDVQVTESMLCRSDAFRIKQIVNNLVGNAIKYTDKGEVRVGVSIANRQLSISVKDTGCGMTPDELQTVFNAFTRLPGAQGKEGVGLGLTITREIVTLLGGNIRVQSTKGKGSTFTVSLPVKIVTNQGVHLSQVHQQSKQTQGVHLSQVHQQSNQQVHQQSQPDSLIGALETSAPPKDNCMIGALETSAPPKDKSQHPTLSVVIVDDDRLQGQLLTEMLQRIEGISFNTTTTIHASEAIAIATKSAPNIVFTDIEMPEMNGSEIMRRIRNNADAQQRPCTTKFVAMTAHEQSIMPQLRSDGFDACLFKPFSVQTLAATICQLTGVAVRVSENSKLKTAGETENSKLKSLALASVSTSRAQNSELRTALLPFTDGDPEAERQIIGDIRKSIEEYLEMIGDGSDPERIAKAVHKAMPLLEMLEPGKNEWLAPLQGVHLSQVHQQSKQQAHQQSKHDSLVGALETSAPPNKQQVHQQTQHDNLVGALETSAPPDDQERERLTKQLIEKLKNILCNIY
ncbi:hybrid sensor histidine kinase/response regulator [Leyella stercorea]|uniref:hybrid sensor histidine kinase/response regulator n=1 Tax=Leyella stercorea TaxID=363265 RepID=UPI00243119FF|nr:hybrid sensor histidine kinase/response regulator [Leyella stercorea]